MLRAALRGRHTALGATRAASAALGAKRNYSAKLACLDLEGVLIPEVWVNLAERVGLDSLKRTTRDEPDYNKLMRYRLDIMEKEGLTLKDIQAAIDTMEPLPGALQGTIARDATFVSHPLQSTALTVHHAQRDASGGTRTAKKAILARRNAPLLAMRAHGVHTVQVRIDGTRPWP